MPRSRIILDTSDQRKSAMLTAASLQGDTLTDWLEEHVSASLSSTLSSRINHQNELDQVGELEDTEALYKTLSCQDWSFTDDDTRYLTHDLHPYPAKFIPQIPATLIARLSMPGDVVLDPFGGSATTAVESVRLGRRAISLDANPLCALIGRVKTGFMASDVRTDLKQLYVAVEGHIASYGEKLSNWTNSSTIQDKNYLPAIPNIEKWFEDHVVRELCLICYLINRTTDGLARDAAQLALSRIIVRVSNQESETRYVSIKKNITPSLTLRAYHESLKTVIRRLETAAIDLQYSDAVFMVGDSRYALPEKIGENSVDLIVTSPPYPNATDYHLYHRFRLFWLGFDPKLLGKIEIGSHLRHQRNNTGFEEYQEDMKQALEGCSKVLMPGRYAVFVVGDALFKGEIFSTCEAIYTAARDADLDVLGAIERPVHKNKRSFSKPARRTRFEQLVILRKPNRPTTVILSPPTYRMWPYERELRAREITKLIGVSVDYSVAEKPIELQIQQPALWQIRRLTYTQSFTINNQENKVLPTWQNILENGDADPTNRKDPKYVTHGIHPFKGKFYPQLAKSLMNMSGAPVGARLFDPYCGSGTTLLEGMLNGFSAYGCDVNPLAAKIAHAKTAILSESRYRVDHSIGVLLDRISQQQTEFPEELDQFKDETHTELTSWFPDAVLYKLNWLLSQIRLMGNPILVNFFEVITSSIIREISHQDPTDLRIRRRKETLQDAPVLELFRDRLEQQYARLRKYWSVAGRQPGKLIFPMVIQGDSRKIETIRTLGIDSDSVDCVVTSPPFATALPYIDTDRLSLLAIMGISSKGRANLEEVLTGSREITVQEKRTVESQLLDKSAEDILPSDVVNAIRGILDAQKSHEVGFRRANMPSLLWRYFMDMKENLLQVTNVLKSEAKAFYVVGDSRTSAGEEWIQIKTCQSIKLIGEMAGLRHVDTLNINVTKENFKNIKNAITENQVIVFEKI